MSTPCDAVQVDVGPDGTTLVLRGRVTVEQARSLHERAVDARLASGPVTVECADVERLDASAVQLLLALRAALTSAGRPLVLAHVPAAVDATLRLAGVAGLLRADGDGRRVED